MRTDWRLVALLFIAGLFAAAQFAKIALTLEDLAAVYPGLPLPYAVSALSVVGIIFGTTAGVIVARIGVRRVLISALVAAAVLSGLQALTPPFAIFMGLRLAEGAAHLAIVVAAPTLMAAVSDPRDVPVSMGLWGTFFGVGFAASAAVIPMLGGPAGVYAAHGAGLLVLAAALWPILPRGVARAEDRDGFVARHLAIYRNPRLVAPALGFLWHTLMFLGLLTYLPGLLAPWTAPLLPIVALVGTFGAGVLARRIAPHQIAMAGFVLTILGMGVLIVAPEGVRPVLALPVFVLIGLVPGASFATVPALNADGADQARANGAIAQLGNVGTATSTPLFAATLGAGFAGPALAAMAISAIGLGAVWLIHRKIARTG
ncbi:MAG: MFS transporter [Pseudomonadota bacterium]